MEEQDQYSIQIKHHHKVLTMSVWNVMFSKYDDLYII